jgi:hypothetical protein
VERSAEHTVETLLDAVGISPDHETLAELARVYPMFRAALDTMYRVPEAHEASPALVFNAALTHVDWSDQNLGDPTATPLANDSNEL